MKNNYKDWINPLKSFKEKNVNIWILEHEQMVETATSIMVEMNIGKDIYEFHDADFINNNRIKTFSDYLIKDHNATIISRNLENGNFDGVNIIHSKKDYFGDLFEYITVKNILNKSKKTNQNSISYNYTDSIIFDEFQHRIENYIKVAIALGKDCFLPIIGYKNSKYVKNKLEELQQIKEKILNINGIDITEVENHISCNDEFVKIMHIRKQ